MRHPCEKCGSYNFAEERTGATLHFNICCQNGKISTDQIRHCAPPPPELLEMLEGRSAAMREARSQLKRYNNAFAFVSYGEDCFNDVQGGRGPPVTICHGTVYHNSGFLFPDDGEAGKYAQVYLYDHNEATRVRQQNHWNQELDNNVLRQLQNMMDRVSQYVSMYHTKREFLRNNLRRRSW